MKQIRDFVDKAIESKDETQLMSALYKIINISNSNDEIVRQEKIDLFLKVRNGVVSQMDPNFDVRKGVVMNVAPAGGKYPPGTDPASIKDPAVRKDYERAIAGTRKINSLRMKQILLQKLLDEIDVSVAIYCVNAFGSSALEQRAERLALKQFSNSESIFNKAEWYRKELGQAK